MTYDDAQECIEAAIIQANLGINVLHETLIHDGGDIDSIKLQSARVLTHTIEILQEAQRDMVGVEEAVSQAYSEKFVRLNAEIIASAGGNI